jgi:hypothetical protein
MSLSHRWSMTCIWPALLAYLIMFGIDGAHIHRRLAGMERAHSISITAHGHNDCSICDWHAMSYAACIEAELVFACAGATPAETGTRRLIIPLLKSTRRARAPPSPAGIPSAPYSHIVNFFNDGGHDEDTFILPGTVPVAGVLFRPGAG